MKKTFLLVGSAMLFLGAGNMAQATLTTIGTAQFGGTGEEYNLIWDDDNNGVSLIWLDYTHYDTDWDTQNAWAAGLGATLTYNIDSTKWTVDWGDSDWRLPDVGSAPGWDYNQTSSEIGHLFYDELGLDKGTTTGDELNASNFDNLLPFLYWTGSELASNPERAWYFYMGNGFQTTFLKGTYGYGLAVHNAQVSPSDKEPVPEPTTMLLFSTGMVALAAARRKKERRA